MKHAVVLCFDKVSFVVVLSGYIKPMTDWFAELLPRIKPMLYKNGGPVIMVQVRSYNTG